MSKKQQKKQESKQESEQEAKQDFEQEAKKQLSKKLFKTIKHFFPLFLKWLKNIEDPRNPNKTTYPPEVLFWIGICIFLLKIGARRQVKFKFNSTQFIANLNAWLGCDIERSPHGDTVKNFFSQVPIEVLLTIRLKMIRTLLRKKCFQKGRLLNKYYLIAIDGTDWVCFSKRHCEHCLTKTLSNGRTIYYHPLLEAKLVLPNGMVISIGSVFIKNPSDWDRNPKAKQDCELKAFYRLAPQLKKDFPQLQICLLLDSLYANQNVFSICKEYGWKYIITFKEGSIPTVAKEYHSLADLQPENTATYQNKRHNLTQEYRWVTEINYEDHLVNVIECKETTEKGTTKFVWVTNLLPTKQNYRHIADEGGRLRWKIENQGFNTQKNGGYALEHQFCLDPVAMKNFYLSLQIAHLLNQLLEYGLLGGKKEIYRVFGSIKNIASALLAALQYTLTDFAELEEELSIPFQIRLYWDTS